MKHVVAIVALWVLAIIATAAIVNDRAVFTYLAPLYVVCMIGSLVVVRKAHTGSNKPALH